MRSAFALLALTLVAVAAVAMAAQNPMRPGNWETTIQMHMANVPMQMPEMKTTQCITPEQLEKDPASGLPQGMRGRGGNNQCEVSDYKVTGHTVSWKMACAQQQMTAAGELTFSGDSYTGTMKASMPQGEMTMKMTGKRLGDCTE